MKTKDNMRSNDFDAKESTVLLQEEGSQKVTDVFKDNDFTLLQQEKRTLSCATKISIFLIIATVLTSMVILDVKLSGRSLYEESSSPIIDEELNDKELFTVANYDVDTKTMAYLSAHKGFAASRYHIDTDFFNDGGIIFYKGNRAAVQDILCGKSGKKTREFRYDSYCANDYARSAKIFNTRKGTAFAVYDNSNLSMEDDFAIIEVTKDIDDVGCFVDTFQSSTTSCGVRVTYYRNNGLDGKVSAWSIQPSGVHSIIGNGLILFYEGNNGSQNLVCTLKVKMDRINFKNDSYGCDNDEARSLVLSYVKAGTRITIYDSPDAKTNDDYTVITVKRSIPYYRVNSFQGNINDDYVKATYHRKNGLDGKVSYVKIDIS